MMNDVMRPRGIFWWKSFWLGLAMLCFLGWVGVRSVDRHESVIRRGPGTKFVEAGYFQGVFRVIDGKSDLELDTARVRWESQKFGRRIEEEKRRWALGATTWEAYFTQKWWIAFPMWVLPAGWAVLWVGLLGWRWRRVRRHLTEMEAVG
ncbi:hypothetical protein [Luteolibacter soli]